jgi:signal transduction histidine kinase
MNEAPRSNEAAMLVVDRARVPATPDEAAPVIERGMRVFTLQRLGAVCLFCAIYGAVLGLDHTTGGIPRSAKAYFAGVALAFAAFLPIFVATGLAASIAPRRMKFRAIVLSLTVVAGVAVARYVTAAIQGIVPGWNVGPPPHAFAPLPLIAMGWLGLAAWLLLESEEEAANRLHEIEARKLDTVRDLAEARLQALQSQIEPHFLFNSLAHVRRLYRTDPRAGKLTLRYLSRYLGSALRALRDPWVALEKDTALALDYLNVQKIRLGERLEFSVDLDAGAIEARVPPLTVVTLVENAIKHGIAPLPEGGGVTIAARRIGSTVRVEVSDTGRGFQRTVGAGVGLANLRGRLATLHGDAAALSLRQNMPRGVIATVVVPAVTQARPRER